ncbi:unnamed protein product [Parascedosporium putredinis]|uniref:Uncharacterized protein n=1 Tax=Parascedosporium putredinis TaxID=1442378 RepID=A0A9P1GXS8_9PEZI|nr:unnamed protein product [Parascedosporium putredinis]CAI7990022.1 unnamed protein product [Parascedosporium putredinis]
MSKSETIDLSGMPAQSPNFLVQPNSGPRKAQANRKQHRNQRRAGRPGASLIEDDDFSMMQPHTFGNGTSRRGQTSITHLLDNYHAPMLVPGMDNYHTFARTYRRNPHWEPGSGYRQADKLRYVRANYRFVVSPEGSYSSIASDADAQIDWNNVLQVVASSLSQTTSCPICLSDPVAPRMAQRKWRKCPICEDRIQLSDVRPVRFYAGQESPLPRPGEDVVLRLMGRSAASTLAMPREGGTEALDAGDDIAWQYAANAMDYGRVMKANGSYMVEQHEEEIAALEKQEKEDECMFGSDGEWTQKAIKAIRNAQEASHGKHASGPDFFFYSAPPHLYLSPLDIRILKTKYGDFSLFPCTLLPRVEHISTGHVVDDALRRRAKYLGHLPRGCLISFLECDWTDIVPAETLEQFADEIERRRKRNRDKATQEERLRLQAERLEAAAIRSTGLPRYDPVLDDVDTARVDFSEADFCPWPRPGFSQLVGLSTSPSASRTVWGTVAVPGSPTSSVTRAANVDDGWLNDADFLGDASIAAQLEALGIEDAAGASAANGNNEAAPGLVLAGEGGGALGGEGSANVGKVKGKKKKQKITLMSTVVPGRTFIPLTSSLALRNVERKTLHDIMAASMGAAASITITRPAAEEKTQPVTREFVATATAVVVGKKRGQADVTVIPYGRSWRSIPATSFQDSQQPGAPATQGSWVVQMKRSGDNGPFTPPRFEWGALVACCEEGDVTNGRKWDATAASPAVLGPSTGESRRRSK